MPKPKLLLCEFLEKHLDEAKTRCLQWVDRDKKIFRLHWIHANSPSWSPEDAMIFREWAMFKGRYQQNPDRSWPVPDYTTWKANFRCAVNRSNDIEEVKVEGNWDKDVKTYQLLQRRVARPFDEASYYNTDSNSSAEAYQAAEDQPGALVPKKEVRCNLNTDCYETVSFANETLTQYVPEVVATLVASPPGSMDTGAASEVVVQGFPNQQIIYDLIDLLEVSNNPENSISKLRDLASMESPGIHPEIGNGNSIELPESLSLLNFSTAPLMTDMCVWLRYRERVVGKHYVRCERGFRVMNPDVRPLQPLPEKVQGSKLIGTPSPAMTFSGPQAVRHIDSTEHILKAIANGLHLVCDNAGNIYATRLTNCRVYHADPTLKNAAEPMPLPRHNRVKVFDRETFEGRLRAWRDKKGQPQPSICILFALGEAWSLTKPINKCLVTVTVAHAHSVFQRDDVKKVRGPDSLAVDDGADEMCAAIQAISTRN